MVPQTSESQVIEGSGEEVSRSQEVEVERQEQSVASEQQEAAE